jgi:hypothetical protein
MGLNQQRVIITYVIRTVTVEEDIEFREPVTSGPTFGSYDLRIDPDMNLLM